MKIKQKIGVWGDSILKGVILDEVRGTYRLLKNNSIQKIQQVLGIEVVNKTRFGGTIDKGYDQLKRSIKKGLDCDVVLLEYGGNDCDFDWQAVAENPQGVHKPRTPLPEFLRTLKAMVDLLIENGIQPALMSLPPISGPRYLDFIVSKGPEREALLRFLGEPNQIYQYHEWYSLSITNLAAHDRCFYVPVREAFLARGHCHDLLCHDGIHPNEAGHHLIEHVLTQMAQQNKLLPEIQ
jgi:acyl-CoA thioesterase I